MTLLLIGVRVCVVGTLSGLAVLSSAVVATANPADDAALAAADAYIAANRRGQVKVKIPAPAKAGDKVDVSLDRIAFNFGGGAPGGFLNLNPSALQARYQAKVLENFNAVSTKGSGMWQVNEPTPGDVQLWHSNWMSEFAAKHGLATRLHTQLFEYGDPQWIATMKTAAVSDQTAKENLRAAIKNRAGYFINNPGNPFDEIDVYNESYTNGELGDPNTYWNLLGASGIADVYHDAQVAATAAGYKPRLMVNDGWDLRVDGTAQAYVKNVQAIQDAATAKGYGKVVDAMGIQIYQTGLDPNLPSKFAKNMQALAAAGLPMEVTEFGGFKGTTEADAATLIDQTMRLAFGQAQMTGMFVWDWTDENDPEQWAPYAALYKVTGPNYDNWEITPAGKVWQDRLGIKNWDGEPGNAWDTQLTVPVAADQTITFTGYYGDYKISVGDRVYNLTIEKGKTQYELGEPTGVAGDF